jgi:hypothetical protein
MCVSRLRIPGGGERVELPVEAPPGGRNMTRYDAATLLADGKYMIAKLDAVMAVLMISG